ncbi:MAG TPA: class I SAM-dependent methyltransferase [Candidatus Angelobacter sp.]|nr:class I SAM-dependent methyltransferase [Candidatus Angelobacter sp.]
MARSGLFTMVWRRIGDGMARDGLVRTLAQMAEAIFRIVVELTPERRKARYGDLDFDLDHSVDTTRANVSLRTQLAATLAGHPYFATEPWLFAQIMQALPADLQEFTFVDLGSGKGRVLLMASAYPFRRIVGVEFLPSLHQSALRNIAQYRNEEQQCRQIESHCMDARDFPFPDGPLVVYMFNSFPEAVFAAILENLRRSISEKPRPLYVAYRYLEFEHLLAQCEWLKKTAGTEHWAMYETR